MRRLVLAGLLLPAAALCAAPFTAGDLAKTGLKDGIADGGAGEITLALLTLSSLATTLLMARFAVLIWRKEASGPPVAVPWAILTGAGIGLPLAWPALTGRIPALPGKPLETALPLVVAIFLAVVVAVAFRILGVGIRAVPPGEVLALFERRPGTPLRRPGPSRFAAYRAGWRLPAFVTAPADRGTWVSGATAALVLLFALAGIELAGTR